MSKVLTGVVVSMALAVGLVGGYGYGRWYGVEGDAASGGDGAGLHNGRKVLYWVDPMHPWYKSDKPGIAPDCNMPLEPVYADEAGASGAGDNEAEKGKILYYTDPEDKEYRADAPGLNPETGNDLVPVYANDPANMAPGTVQIDARKQQLIGVQFAKPEMSSAHESIRSSGTVVLDERRVSRVNPKVSGWIDKVFVDFTGDLVKRGQPLLTIYSPELLAGQQEYLVALRAAEALAKSSVPGVKDRQQAMVRAARQRLQLLDLDEKQIAELERTREPQKHVTVYAPATGFVMERNAFPSQRVTPEMSLYTVADLSRVWVMADVFEYQMATLRQGMPVSLRFPYDEGKSFQGKVAYVQPGLEAATRTLQARIEVSNAGLRLRPGMYLDVLFNQHHEAALTIPASAVLDTGTRQTVFVHRGNGYMEPRVIQVGRRFEDRIEVLGGIGADDEIVVSGNFLIDSESQLQTGPRELGGSSTKPPAVPASKPATSQPAMGGHEHHRH